MRCPICNERVRNHDSLQTHYLEDCTGVGSTREGNGGENEELEENLVEVDFKWVNTKGTFEENISLVSSLAGQIILERKSDGEIYQSSKAFVPCGIHCCQLVIGDECYPVFDIDIDDTQESLYAIIQSDVENSGNEDPSASNAAVESETERDQTNRFEGNVGSQNGYAERTRSSGDESKRKAESVKQRHQIDPEYAREVLRRISREDSAIENDYQETKRFQSSDYESQVSENDASYENPLARIASNDVHEVQIHSSTKANQNNNTQTSHKRERSKEGGVMFALTANEREKEPSKSEYLGTENDLDPNDSEGHQSYLQTGRNRSRRLDQYGGGFVGSSGTLSDQLAFQESLAPRTKKEIQKKKKDDMEEDEQEANSTPTWGFDEPASVRFRDNQRKTKDFSERREEEAPNPKYKSSKSEPYDKQLQEERILELHAKCDSYESELTRFRKENDDLIKQLYQMQQEIETNERKQTASLNTKIEALKLENKQLREENESLKTGHTLQVDDLTRINNGLIDEVTDLTAKVDNLKLSQRSYQNNNDSRKILQLEAEVSTLRLDNEELKSKLARIRREFTASQTDVSENHDRRDTRAYDKYSSTSFDNESDYFARKTRRSEPDSPREPSYLSHDRPVNGTSYVVHEPVIKSSHRSRDYDDYSSTRKSILSDDYERKQRSPRQEYKFDANYNYLPNHDLTTSRYKSHSSRNWDNSNDAPTEPRSRLNKSDSYEPRSSTNYAREHVDIDSILAPNATQVTRREKKTRRERPHSFHGGVTSSSYFDSSSSNIMDTIQSTNRYSSGQRDSSYSSGLDNIGLSSQDKSATCFYPTSPDDISVGMRALVTRTSGRLGKGLVKWKGQLPGHSECFLGIELESPNGKHDGTFEGRRYFQCKRDYGIFAKFSKVVMVWVPRK